MAEAIMRINKKVIDVRWFPSNNIMIKGYLDGLVNDMLECNNDIIKRNRNEPEFQVRIKTRRAAVRDLSMREEVADVFTRYDLDFV